MAFDPHRLFKPPVLPEATRHLGAELLDYDADKGWVKLTFMPRPEFLNPRGGVQGGFITAMLDEAFSVAAFIGTGACFATPTVSATTNFMRPVGVEALTGEGWITKRGKSIVFARAELRNAAGGLCADCTASILLMPLQGVQGEAIEGLENG